MKNTRIRWAVALAGAAVITVSLGLATVALASPSSGTITPVIIATGSMPTGMGLAVHPGTNTIVGQYTFGPHSSTGWHSHPGKTLVVVQSGTFTVYHDNCHAMTYGPGSRSSSCPRACTSVATRPTAACSWASCTSTFRSAGALGSISRSRTGATST